MKALVKAKSEPGLWLQDVPDPKCGINDVLIRVDRTGICGTDLHIYKWDAWAQKTIPVPMVVGHEFVGYVVITDVNEHRLELAKKMGADVALDVTKGSLADVQKQLAMTEGFDVGLEMSGNPAAFRSMIDGMAHGGKIAMLGIPSEDIAIDWNKVVFNMLTIKGIYGREMYETWYKMSVMLQSGLDITPVITHRFGADEFEKGFEAMMSGRSGKVILNWR